MKTKIKTIFSSIFFTSAALMISFFSHFFVPPNNEGASSYITIGVGIIAFIGILPALSIISTQHASAKWSPIIAKLYKDDPKLKWISRVIGIIGLIFLSLQNSYDIKGILLFCLCGVSLDCLICYYHKVCDLLDPNTACDTLAAKAEKIIDNFQCKAQGYAKKNLEKEKEFYQGDKFENLKKRLFFFSNELGLIGYKAVINYEYNTVQAALNKLVKFVQCYARNRKNNFSPDRYSKNSDRVIDPICEDINNIFKVALQNQDKKIIRTIFEAYGEIISAFLLISFRITLERYNNKDEYSEVRKDIFIIGLDEFYRCQEAMLKNFPTGIEEVNSLIFYNSFFDATKIAVSNLTDLQKFCFYISIIRKIYSYLYNQHLKEDEFNYYLMIGFCLGSIPSIAIEQLETTKSDTKEISVILDANEWLELIKETNSFFSNPDGLSFSWFIKIIKQNMEHLKSKFQNSEEEKKIDAIIKQLDEILSNRNSLTT